MAFGGIRGRAGRWRLGQALQDDRRQARQNLRADESRRLRRLGCDLREEILQVVCVKRRLSGQQVAQRRADGVDVGAYIERFPAQLFGRRKLRRALEAAGGDVVPHVPRERRDRQAEVFDLHGPFAGLEAVRWLDAAGAGCQPRGRRPTRRRSDERRHGMAGPRGMMALGSRCLTGAFLPSKLARGSHRCGRLRLHGPPP